MFCSFIESQMDFEWCYVERLVTEVKLLRVDWAKFTIKAILEGNDKLTCFYTGLPTYDSLIALVTYLEPKAIGLRLWNGSKTRGEDKIVESGVRCFTSLTIADQLFSVLIQL